MVCSEQAPFQGGRATYLSTTGQVHAKSQPGKVGVVRIRSSALAIFLVARALSTSTRCASNSRSGCAHAAHPTRSRPFLREILSFIQGDCLTFQTRIPLQLLGCCFYEEVLAVDLRISHFTVLLLSHLTLRALLRQWEGCVEGVPPATHGS